MIKDMEMHFNYFKMEINIMDNLLAESIMEKEYIYGLMDQYIKVNGSKVINKEMVNGKI